MLKVEYVPIESVKPYQGNVKRHPRKQIDQIKESIKQFGFNDPIAIDAKGTIIEGHGRYQALTELGYKEIPVIKLEGLTEAQRKAYTIVHNKLTIETGLDTVKLQQELCKFPAFNFGQLNLKFDFHPKINAREETFDNYRLAEFNPKRSTKQWQMPILKPCKYIPERLIGFNYMLTSKDKACGIHFFIDDYQFERIWKDPYAYINDLKEYECVLTPDFSLYMDMALPLKIYNVYRSRLIGQILQDKGIKVIPTVQWAGEDTFGFCLEGLPKHSPIAVSSVGVMKDAEALKVWKAGMDYTIKTLEPIAVLIYGNKIPDYDYKGIKTQIYKNGVTERMKKGKDN